MATTTHELVREGSGRWTQYALPEHADYLSSKIERILLLEGLKEHEALDDIMRMSTALRHMPENIREIFNYAFSEMLNNAIDHSKSKQATIRVSDDKEKLRFTIKDNGIGVFRNVMKKRELKSELEAIQDLLKGKTTTAPQAHSGEGIFFTSKASDVFILDSFRFRLRIDNIINDIFVEELDANQAIQGTRVQFEIATNSKKHLNRDIFAKYQVHPDQPAFDKTEITIKLYTMGTIYVSRSQARRVLSDLQKFKLVVLDFEGVPTIGQAFADEIFRVFKAKHPGVEILPINTNEAVQFMIERAKAT